ncbi:MAG TPA: FAD/NAD(P)-binding oxidoreductase, partial [Ginsengibacter sp.]|nr:FAD/NAD(P)-binding oxidoreductase [Ginsengibacter sp.]
MLHHQILIVGGGNAGISVASQLLRRNKALEIAIIEPSENHYYQPAWTLVGGGVFNVKDTIHKEAEVMPKAVKWIKKKAASFQPENNIVVLEDNEMVSYEYLIVAPGIQLNWNAIKGLKETLGSNGVCSNYNVETASYTWQCIRNFKGGKALFTNPDTPVKCGGAPHKIMWLAADYFKKHRVFDKASIQYWSGGTRLFGVEKYEQTLKKVAKR